MRTRAFASRSFDPVCLCRSILFAIKVRYEGFTFKINPIAYFDVSAIVRKYTGTVWSVGGWRVFNGHGLFWIRVSHGHGLVG